jgi:hypothetical protein
MGWVPHGLLVQIEMCRPKYTLDFEDSTPKRMENTSIIVYNDYILKYFGHIELTTM